MSRWKLTTEVTCRHRGIQWGPAYLFARGSCSYVLRGGWEHDPALTRPGLGPLDNHRARSIRLLLEESP